MEVTILNTIRRVDILTGLIITESRFIFEVTIINFINDSSLENYEKNHYVEIFKLFQSQDIETIKKNLNAFRADNVLKLFANPCDKKWNSLIPTNNSDINFCSDCKRNVFKVYNQQDYRKRKQLNQCVAISFYLNEKFTPESTACEFIDIETNDLLGLPSSYKND